MVNKRDKNSVIEFIALMCVLYFMLSIVESGAATDSVYKDGYQGQYVTDLIVRAKSAGDYNAAIAIMRPYADRNVSQAQDDIGTIYTKLNNYKSAVIWYNKAIKNGNARSMFNLAFCYETGNGVDKNISKAINLYTKAAKKGHIESMNTLGHILYHGDNGAVVDKDKAYGYWLKAAKLGHRMAIENVCAYVPPMEYVNTEIGYICSTMR